MVKFLAPEEQLCIRILLIKLCRHPAIVFKFFFSSSEVNSSNIKIIYRSSGSIGTNNAEQILKMGINYIPTRRFNKTEVILLDSLVSDKRALRITSLTPIVKNKKGLGGAEIRVEHHLMNNNKSNSWENNNIRIFFTSVKNSLGSM